MWATISTSTSTADNPSEFQTESQLADNTERKSNHKTNKEYGSQSQTICQRAINETPPLFQFLLLWLMCTRPVDFTHMFSFKVDTAQRDTEGHPELPGLDSHCHSMAFLFISCFVERFIDWLICFYVCKAADHCSCWTLVHSGLFQHFLMAIGSKEGKSHQEWTDWSQGRVQRQAPTLSSIRLIVRKRGGCD